MIVLLDTVSQHAGFLHDKDLDPSPVPSPRPTARRVFLRLRPQAGSSPTICPHPCQIAPLPPKIPRRGMAKVSWLERYPLRLGPSKRDRPRFFPFACWSKSNHHRPDDLPRNSDRVTREDILKKEKSIGCKFWKRDGTPWTNWRENKTQFRRTRTDMVFWQIPSSKMSHRTDAGHNSPACLVDQISPSQSHWSQMSEQSRKICFL